MILMILFYLALVGTFTYGTIVVNSIKNNFELTLKDNILFAGSFAATITLYIFFLSGASL